jgi:hypothetical protein
MHGILIKIKLVNIIFEFLKNNEITSISCSQKSKLESKRIQLFENKIKRERLHFSLLTAEEPVDVRCPVNFYKNQNCTTYNVL